MKYLTALLIVLGLLVPAFALAGGSLTTTTVYPSDTVVPGMRVSFIVVPSGLSYPYSYYVVDSFPGGVNSGAIDAAGNFVWTPNASAIGTHTVAITVTDSQNNTANTSVVLTVLPGPAVTVAATSSATVGYPLAFAVTTSGLFSPTYIVGDSFRNSSLRINAIDYSNTLRWTPLAQDVGQHTITVSAKDSFGNATSTAFDVLVAPVGGWPVAATTTAATTSSQTSSTVSGSVSTPQSAPPVQAKATYAFTKFMSVGSSGADVTALQSLLTALGFYSGPVTGYFGNLTKAGLAAYQSAHGIDAVGYAGPMTRAALSQGK